MPRKIQLKSDDLRDLYVNQRLSLEQIAHRQGYSLGTIYRRLCEAGIPRRTRQEAIRLARGLQLNDAKVAKMYRQGLSANKIAQLEGCSAATVITRLELGGVVRRSSSAAMLLDRGVEISDEHIRELYINQLLSAADIAQQIGCTSTTIYRRLKACGISRRTTSQAARMAWSRGKCTSKARTVLLTVEQLREMYIDKQMSINEIAQYAACSLMTVHQRLHTAGIQSRSLSQAQRLRVLQGKRRVISVNRDFFKHWSREMAYALGVIATDGNLASDKPRIMIAQAKRELLDKVGALMGCKGGISWTGKKTYRLSFQSPELYADLLALGLTPRKSRTLLWLEVPEPFLRDFVRGCWDGDGSVSFQSWRTASASFYSGSLTFIEGLRNALYKLGIPAETVRIHKITRQNSVYYQMHLMRGRAAPLFAILYANTPKTMYLSRKRKLFSRIAQQFAARAQKSICKMSNEES